MNPVDGEVIGAQPTHGERRSSATVRPFREAYRDRLRRHPDTGDGGLHLPALCPRRARPLHHRRPRDHPHRPRVAHHGDVRRRRRPRSEEHTSELQSRPHLVCRLLLEKKKKKRTTLCYTKKKNKIQQKYKYNEKT